MFDIPILFGSALCDCKDCLDIPDGIRSRAPSRVKQNVSQKPRICAVPCDIAVHSQAGLDRQTNQTDHLLALLCGLNLPILHVFPDLSLSFMTPAAAALLDLGNSDGRLSEDCDICNRVIIARVRRTGGTFTHRVCRKDGRIWDCHILPRDTRRGRPSGAIVIMVEHPVTPPRSGAETLTPRQHQIMDLVLAGHPSKNIAADLHISQRTVECHRAAIMDRTGATSLPALARMAAGIAEDTDSRRPAVCF